LRARLSIRLQAPGQRLRRVGWGIVAGIAISSGFLGTYWVATQRLRRMARASHSFTAPIGETIHYAMFSSGLAPKFGMGSVLGVILGGAIGSFIQDGFRWEACEDPRELRRQMGGAVAMGLGAVLAAGCSVGQGLSALSLLSTTAPIVAASIWIGAWIGLRHARRGDHRAGWRPPDRDSCAHDPHMQHAQPRQIAATSIRSSTRTTPIGHYSTPLQLVAG
jgi:hypothetical protein